MARHPEAVDAPTHTDCCGRKRPCDSPSHKKVRLNQLNVLLPHSFAPQASMFKCPTIAHSARPMATNATSTNTTRNNTHRT